MALHPDYPVVDGHYQLTEDWSLTLDQPVSRRIENGSMVLWRPGFTIWLNVWGNDNDEMIGERADWIIGDASPDAYDVTSQKGDGIVRFSFRLDEDNSSFGYYGYVIVPDGHAQISVYFDSEVELAEAKAIVGSVSYRGE